MKYNHVSGKYPIVIAILSVFIFGTAAQTISDASTSGVNPEHEFSNVSYLRMLVQAKTPLETCIIRCKAQHMICRYDSLIKDPKGNYSCPEDQEKCLVDCKMQFQ